jgi:uncharacterized protein with GYD domain
MGLYVMLSTLTDEGRRTVKERPARIKEVNREVELMGVQVLAQYATLGPYDFINIVEAPDTATIMRVSVELGSRGTMQVTSLVAMNLEDYIAMVASPSSFQ